MSENKSKTASWDKSVARASGQNMPENAAPQIPVGPIVKKATGADEIAKIMSDPSLEFAPQLYSMEEGDLVEGVLEGNGPETEFERIEKGTGVVSYNTVQTWIIRSHDGGQRISILSSAQLDRKLPPFVGGAVKIVRGRNIDTSNGQRVTDYLVAGPKAKDGSARSWATPAKAIDVTAAQPQLSAGAEANTNNASTTAH